MTSIKRYVMVLFAVGSIIAATLGLVGSSPPAEAQQLCRQQCYAWCDKNRPNSPSCEAACRQRPLCGTVGSRPSQQSCTARCHGFKAAASKEACLKYCKGG